MKKSSSSPVVVGVSAEYHDSAVCVLTGGHVVAAIQEERLSRRKNDRDFPWRAFRSCLDEAGLTIADVDCIAYYENTPLKQARQIWMGLNSPLTESRREATLRRMTGLAPEALIRRQLGFDGRIEVVGHHLSHAASAFYWSRYREAAVLTADGVGEWATTTYGRGDGADLEIFDQVDFPHSLGLMYSAITGYLGFEVNEGEYKVMGLAPYGAPKYVDKIEQLIENAPGGGYRLNLKYFGFLEQDRMYSDELPLLLGQPARVPESELEQFHMDVAKSVQVVLEQVLLDKLRYLHAKVPSDSLCMAGGVALNVVANSRCLAEGPFTRLFVQPAAGDAGGALGAAALAHVRLTGEHPCREPLAHVYWGPTIRNADVRRLFEASTATVDDCTGDQPAFLRRIVEYLIQGKIVGWCQGRMEFGPRALGGRSILADPRDPGMRDRINALVKQRESFRPFAPAVLLSKAQDYFALNHPSPFMLEVCQVASPIPLPAITHVDGSARVQTVTADTNPRFAALLEEFYAQTGCPILLNTSFNMRGEPIVCTAVDAIACFVRSKLDVLAIDEFILEQGHVPPLWELSSRKQPARRDDTHSQLVYTFF